MRHSKGWYNLYPPLLWSFRPRAVLRKILCWNTEGLFRLIQSIPSPKAEPFKRWLAKVGYERIREIEDPELATKRARALYKAKGYSDDWIEKRLRSIAIRDELTGEWKKRGVKGGARVRHPHGGDLPGHLRPHAQPIRRAQAAQARKPPRSQ